MSEKPKVNIHNIKDNSEYYELINQYRCIKMSQHITPFEYFNDELSFINMPYYYIDYKEYDKFILCGHTFNMIVSGLLEDRYKITLFIRSNQINYDVIDNLFDYRSKSIISFYSKNGRLIEKIPTIIDKDVKVYNKYLYQIDFNMPHYFRCMCGFSDHIYQKLVTYMSRNISNIIYKTHYLPSLNKVLGYINITKGENDALWHENWLKRRAEQISKHKIKLHKIDIPKYNK